MGLIRSLLVALALACFLVLALVANVGVWSVSTLVDSGAFAATTTRILSQPEVRSLLAQRLATRLTDLLVPAGEPVPAAVRKGLALLPGVTRDMVQQAFANAIHTILADPGMVDIQDSALESLHRTVLAAISGEAGSTADDGIALDLDAVVKALDQRVDPDHAGFLGQDLPAGLGTLTLVPPSQLTLLARIVQLLEALRWLLPAVCIAVALLVLLLARARLHAIAWLGLCLVMVGALCMLAASGAPLIAARLLGSHPDALASTEAALDGLTASLLTQSAVVAGLGLAMLVVGITAGIVTGRPDERQHLDRYA